MTYLRGILACLLIACSPASLLQAQTQQSFDIPMSTAETEGAPAALPELGNQTPPTAFSNSTEDVVLNVTSGLPMTYSTELHPMSSAISIAMFLGDPDDGGALLAQIEDVPLHGTLMAIPILDQTNSGELLFQGGTLALDDITDYVIDLGTFGGLTLDLIQTNIDFQSTSIPVSNTVYSVDDADFFEVSVNGGVAMLRDPVGTVDDVFGSFFPVSFDFGSSPVSANLDNIMGFGVGGTVDLGSGLFTERGEINLVIPDTTFGFGELEGIDIYMQLSGSVHVAVPEPSSGVLALMGTICFGVVGIRRRRAKIATV